MLQRVKSIPNCLKLSSYDVISFVFRQKCKRTKETKTIFIQLFLCRISTREITYVILIFNIQNFGVHNNDCNMHVADDNPLLPQSKPKKRIFETHPAIIIFVTLQTVNIRVIIMLVW
jgi:hypothetical protein